MEKVKTSRQLKLSQEATSSFFNSGVHFPRKLFLVGVVVVLLFTHSLYAAAITPKEKVALEAVYKHIREKYEGDFQGAFDKFDENNNGVADWQEVQNLLTSALLDKYFLRKKWITRILAKLDLDKNQKVTVYELQEASKPYAPFKFKLTEACYDEQCVARTGSPNQHRL